LCATDLEWIDPRDKKKGLRLCAKSAGRNRCVCISNSLPNGSYRMSTKKGGLCVCAKLARNRCVGTGWRRPIGCLIGRGYFPQRALYPVARLRKMTCNLRHPMGLRHPVFRAKYSNICVQSLCSTPQIIVCNKFRERGDCASARTRQHGIGVRVF